MRPGDWTALGLGEDPIPGNPEIVGAAATDYATVASAIEEAASNLRALARADEGVSEAVDAIMEQALEVAGRIERARERYAGVADALGGYAPPLRTAQRWSEDALDRASAARSGRESAQFRVDLYHRRLQEDDLAPALAAQYQQAYWSAISDVRAHDASLEQAMSLLQSAIERRDAAATTAVGAIALVESSGDLNDSWWDNTVQFIEEHKEIIDFVVQVVGWVATAAMVIAIFIPGLNVIAGAIMLIATIVSVANAVIQGLAGTMSPAEAITTIALAALAFVGGRVVANLTKSATTATTQTVATSVKNSYAGSGISGMTMSRATDIVETAGAFGRVRDLTLAQRLMHAGGDYQAIAQMNSMANVQLLSGAHATGAMHSLQHLGRVNAAVTWGGEAINAAGVPGHAGKLTEGSTWRLGGNW